MAIKLKSKSLDTVRSTVPVDKVAELRTDKITLSLAPGTRFVWKQAAIDRRVTMVALIEMAMAEFLDKHKHKAK